MIADLKAFTPEERWFCHNSRGIHGAPHTTRVLIWAATITDRIGQRSALRWRELFWAASVHDVGRVNDWTDPGHGDRSADWLLANLAKERPEAASCDLDFVAELCRQHEVSDHEIPRWTLELMILKDADGLERCRISDLDPKRLRLQTSLGLVEPAAGLERATNAYGRVIPAEIFAAHTRTLDVDRGSASAG